MYRPRQPEPLEPGLPPGGRRAGSRGDAILNIDAAIDDAAATLRRMNAPAPEAARAAPAAPPGPPPVLPGLASLGAIGLDHLLQWLREGRGWIVAAVLLCIAAALAYAFTASPRYSAYTDIVVDPSNLNVVSDDVFISNPQRDAQILEVESKLRVLTSRNVLARVVDELRLTEDLEFVRPDPLAFLKRMLRGDQPQGDARLGALRALGERVDARREERSFVVVLRVWSDDPDKSVVISDAIVTAFEDELFRSAAESAGRVAQNLNERLDELRANVTDAERRVEEFRRANGLQSSNGELVSNQLSSELNTQVLAAQQRLIQAQSRYMQMSAAIDSGQAASAPVFESAAMLALRSQYNALRQQVGSMQLTYGARHPRMTAAVSEQTALETAMAEEARRTLERARAEFDREQTAYDALRSKAEDERSNVFTDNAAGVQLRDLEREARTKAAIYEMHLARAQQIAERQQIDATNVRVISHAMPPNSRSWPPRTLLLLAAATVLGLGLGMAAAVALGLWRHVRTPQPQPHRG